MEILLVVSVYILMLLYMDSNVFKSTFSMIMGYLIINMLISIGGV